MSQTDNATNDTSVSDVLVEVTKAIEAVQDAQTTVVSANKNLVNHLTDPNAHGGAQGTANAAAQAAQSTADKATQAAQAAQSTADKATQAAQAAQSTANAALPATGTAAAASKLATARTIQTDLASTSAASFNGTADVTPGVKGVLSVPSGGTGLSAAPSLLTNLASTTAASPLAASPRPGVTGTLPIANGGTGATTAAGALTNLGAAPANATLADAAESAALPATTSATLAALLQTIRNCLKWILARMDFRTSTVNIYVRTDGNDSNDGFTNSATGAVASWTGVLEVIRRLNVRNANVYVYFQAGTWTGINLVGNGIIGAGNIKLYIVGIEGSTFFSSGIYVDGGWVRFTDCTYQSTVGARYGGHLELYNPAFIGATTAATAIETLDGGSVLVETALSFSGSFINGLIAQAGGLIRLGSSLPTTFKDSCAFSSAYLYAGGSYGPGTISSRGTPTYTGTFTGPRYYMGHGGKITGRTLAQLDAIPGTIAGTRSAGSGVTQSPQFVSSGNASASGYLLADGTDISARLSGSGAFPSGQAVNWALPANGKTVTAPADGYFVITGGHTSGVMALDSGGLNAWTYIPGAILGATFLPVKKGGVVVVQYTVSVTIFQFYYSVGAV